MIILFPYFILENSFHGHVVRQKIHGRYYVMFWEVRGSDNIYLEWHMKRLDVRETHTTAYE